MTPSFEQLLTTAKSWAEQAADAAWLAPGDIRALAELKHRSPASLFEAGIHRPLVAAFFGGTGVGKSTLLNRLAGQAIARTGVERPTSREISIYLHESIQLRNLPPNFPLERVRVAQHRDESRRQVLWIDMPDIDSIEQHNRELVLEWLPHIDVLIYVVSPERYRDDKGWRLLREHGGEHAWLFVINQWDRGHPVQYEDFGKLLAKGGFQNPIILRTDSRETAATSGKADDFEQLRGFLQEMADRHVLRQLEIRAEALRLEGLHAVVADCLDKLGDDRGYQGLAPDWIASWNETRDELMRGLEWPIQNVARAFVGHEANPLRRSIDLTRNSAPKPRAESPSPNTMLWDEWAASRLRDTLDKLVVEAGNRALPVLPFKSGLDQIYEGSARAVLNEGQRSLRLALANPGNALRRAMLKLSGGLAAILPLLSIGLVSYQVVMGYYESFARHLDYLGVDFAIHSTLLIALSWLLPFFVYRQLKPSAELTAIKGLRSGMALGLDRIGEQVAELLARSDRDRDKVREEGRRIAELAAAAARPETTTGVGLLGRVLPAPTAKHTPGGEIVQSISNKSK